MLYVLSRPSSKTSVREDSMRREEALRALFIELPPEQAHDLIRRLDTGDDPLAEAFRKFVRSRRRA